MEFLVDYEEKVPTSEGDNLFIEDIKDHQRLFLIQAPAELNLTRLSGKSVVLNGKQDLIYESAEGSTDKFEVESGFDKDDVSGEMVAILPSKSDNKMHISKAITGRMHISQRISVPHLQCVVSPPAKGENNDFKKHSWKAFGSRSPKRVKEIPAEEKTKSKKTNRKRKHSHMEPSESMKDKLDTFFSNSSLKKKKKKKRKRKSFTEK